MSFLEWEIVSLASCTLELWLLNASKRAVDDEPFYDRINVDV